MRPAAARRILTCHVDDPNGDVPPVMQSALKALAKSPELQADYEKQSLIDASLRTAFKEIEVPDEALSGFAAQVQSIPTRHFNPRDPAIISVIIGFVLLIFVLIWNFLGRPAAFPPDGLEIAEALLSAENSAFQEVAVPPEELEDWFVLKGFDGFKTPPFLLGGKVDSAGILEFEKQPLAVVGLPALNAQLAVFSAAPWNIIVPEGEWRTAQIDPEYAVALSREKEMCFLILFQGNEAGVRAILKGTPR
ncbi:MAG: hypothetical protein ACKOF3_09200 [Spartobacteria bacterium]